MPKVDTPHLSWPIHLGPNGADVVEQDSEEEILQCAKAVLVTPIGHRDDAPDFGIEDQAFRQGGADIPAIRDALETWEDRFEVVIEDDSEIEDLVQEVVIRRGEDTI